MAVGAVVKHGTVLPQERAAFLGVAGVTGFVDRVFDQQFGTSRAVRIVAIGTDHLAGIDRVRGNLVGVRTLLLMAGEAHLGLRPLVANLVDGRMHLVAVIAGQLVVLVLAAFPVGAIISFVASQALAGAGIAVRYREGALLENDVRCGTSLDVGVTVQVFFAFAVAGLAVWRTGITPDAVPALIKGKNR